MAKQREPQSAYYPPEVTMTQSQSETEPVVEQPKLAANEAEFFVRYGSIMLPRADPDTGEAVSVHYGSGETFIADRESTKRRFKRQLAILRGTKVDITDTDAA